MGLTQIVADGTTLTANTSGNHYFSVGAPVILSGTAYSIFDLDGVYTINGIPTANSFTCSTVLSGISFNGTASTVGIQCGDIVSYFSTQNSNLWVNNLTNKTWQITGVAITGNQLTITTSAPSNLPVGSQVQVLISSLFINGVYTIIGSTDTTFTINVSPGPVGVFVAVGGGQSMYSAGFGLTWTDVFTPNGYWKSVAFGNGTFVTVSTYLFLSSSMYSTDNGLTWSFGSFQNGNWSSVAFGNGTFVAVSYDDKSMYSTDNGLTWSLGSAQNGYWTSVAFGNGTFVAVSSDNKSMYSTDNGHIWSLGSAQSGQWHGIAFGNGTFVAVSFDSKSMYSTDNGHIWSLGSAQSGSWSSVAFGNGTFVAVSTDSKNMYSIDNGLTWTYGLNQPSGLRETITYGNTKFFSVSNFGDEYMYSYNGQQWRIGNTLNVGVWRDVSFSGILGNTGTMFENLLAVGSTIYASSNSSSVSSVIQIDTSKDLTTKGAYKYYSSTDSAAPITFDGTAPKIFANGPRFVYMFTQDPSGATTPTNVYRFDPYPPNTNLKASIIVDYESLPSDVAKPAKALIGLVQTQKVTNMDVMDLHGPVKELWITGASSTTNVFQYSNLSNQVTLTFTAGEEMITPDTGTRKMLSVIQPFEMHTSMPIRNVSTFSFEMNPESSTPNGTVNFSRIYEQALTANAATVWARNYNILAIQGGIGGLMFN
jgi:hypothetical protein